MLKTRNGKVETMSISCYSSRHSCRWYTHLIID